MIGDNGATGPAAVQHASRDGAVSSFSHPMFTPNDPQLTEAGSDSLRDPLTGALPKSAFEERLHAAAGRAVASGHGASLLVIDIDHFKSINDAFGHARGDAILREFARRLQIPLQATDSLFRFGGDEFVLLLAAADRRGATAVAHRLLEEVECTPFAGDPPLSVSLSIGTATWPVDCPEPGELFHRADLRLLEAKRRGRGQVASDDDSGESDKPAFAPLSRLVERDKAVEATYAFLRSLRTSKRGVLEVGGPAGAGRTRFLAEVASAGKLLGYEVLGFTATPALGGRAHGMVVDGHPDLEAPLDDGGHAFHDFLAERVRSAGRSGLLVVVDDLPHADPASRDLLRQLVESSAVPELGIVYGTSSEVAEELETGASLRSSIALQPLTPAGLRTWLRTTLQWEPPTEFLSWLHAETSGFPSKVRSGTARLADLGVLSRQNGFWTVDPGYANHSLRGWLDSRAEVRRSNVPAVLSSILGRHREIRDAKRLLGGGRLLTLFGPGGFGKTRLSIQIAAELATEQTRDVFFVPLAAIGSPDGILPAIADVLSLPLRADGDPLQQLVEGLRQKQILLVLDNVEHLVSAAPLIAQLLAALPGLTVLATSRETLGVQGEQVLHVRGMPLPEGDDLGSIQRSPAVQLFLQRARRERSDFAPGDDEMRAIASICRRVEGIPLAIEIAAGLIQVLACREILAEVDGDFEVLRSTTRDRPARHQSLRAVFDFSWNLLPEREQIIWSRLSLLRGGFRREAADRVAGATLPVLTSLLSKSLVHVASAGRYEIHGVLRRYAYERLCARPEERCAAEERLITHFAELIVSLGEPAGTGSATGRFAEGAAEIDNVVSGFELAVERENHTAIERYLIGLFHFHDLSGRYLEGVERFAWAVERIRDERLVALALARQGHLSQLLGDGVAAQALHRRSVALLRRVGRPGDTALSLYSLGTAAREEGDYRRAERLFRRCARSYLRAGSKAGLARCMNDLGTISLLQGRCKDAERLFLKSLELRTSLDDQAGRAKSLTNLGMSADFRGDPDASRRYFQQSLDAARAAGDRKGVAGALNNLGVLAHRVGEETESRQLLEEAGEFLREAFEVYEEIGSAGGAALTLYNLGDVACLLGDFEACERYHLEALRRAAAIGAISLMTTVLLGVAKLLARTGAPERAVELLAFVVRHSATIDDDRKAAERLLTKLAAEMDPELLEELRGSGAALEMTAVVEELRENVRRHPKRAAESLTGSPGSERLLDVSTAIERGDFARRNAQPDVARACYEAALHALRTPADAALAAALIRWVGWTHLAEGDVEAAEDCSAASLAIATAAGESAAVAHAVNLQGAVAYQRCDLDAAVTHYGEARRLAHDAGEDKLLAMAEHNLALVARIRGDLDVALSSCERSLAGFEDLGSEENIVEVSGSTEHARVDQLRSEPLGRRRGCLPEGDGSVRRPR